LPSPPAWFVGRDALAAQLGAAILRRLAVPIVLLGPAGIGKSALTLAALHRRELAERFGARRWFVRLDAAPSAEAVVGLVAAAIGVTPGGDPLAEVCAELSRAPSVLALDNLETPWDSRDERAATEALLQDLSAVPGLVLVAS